MADEEPRVYNDRYELRSHIARGGMAEVYLAHDRFLDRPVALKVLFPELSVDPSFVERFRREAQAAANLTHPNIVSVFDWGEDQNTYFIVMEYIDGRPLSALLKAEGTLLPDRVAAICADVAGALEFAHRHGVIHRDVKPGNVLLTADGTVKVTDFGIARAAHVEDNLTRTGAVMGTATYFSPEQAEGTTVDARSDVYSLGVVLYELVTGRPPFAGDNPVTIAYKHVREDPVPPRKRNPAVPAAFEAVIMQAMAKDPDLRYQTADALRADLLRFRQGRNVLATPPISAQATQAVPMTQVQERYRDPAATTVMERTTVASAAPSSPPAKKGNGVFYTVLALLLIGLAVVAFFLIRAARNRSSGSQVGVPNVIGLVQADAEARLRASGFNPQAEQAPSDAFEKGKVFDQDPKPDAKADRKSGVKIRVSSGAAIVPVPSVVNRSLEDATAILQGAGFNVTVELKSDRRQAGTIIAQNPIGGNRAQQGSSVTLTESTGPEETTTTAPPPTTTTTSPPETSTTSSSSSSTSTSSSTTSTTKPF